MQQVNYVVIGHINYAVRLTQGKTLMQSGLLDGTIIPTHSGKCTTRLPYLTDALVFANA